MRDRIDRLRVALDASPAPERPEGLDTVEGDGRERTAPPLDRIVVRRDRDGAHRGRADHPEQRGGVAGRAPCRLGRDRARGRRAGAPALDRAGPRRGVVGCRRRLVRHRRGRRHLRPRASPARCSSGSTWPKALAWVHDVPLIGVNHLEGHVYAAWLADAGYRATRTRLPAGRPRRVRADTRSSPRCATTSRIACSGPPSTTRPARPSTRSAGCSGSATRVVRRSPEPPRPRTAHDRVFPRAWLGRLLRLQLLGAQDAPPVGS